MILKGRLSDYELQIIVRSIKDRYEEEAGKIYKGYELGSLIIETGITKSELLDFSMHDCESNRKLTSFRIRYEAEERLASLAAETGLDKIVVVRAILNERARQLEKNKKDIDVFKYPCKNLIGVVNPGLADLSGIKAAIMYRVTPSVEIDTSSLVRNAFVKAYGDKIEKKSDTIFNAFVPFCEFCRYRLIMLRYDIKGLEINDLLLLIYLHLDELFDGYRVLRGLFDEFFEVMYSYSNFMPVPMRFNGSAGRNGKGTYSLNKDYPYLYYANLKENCISNAKQMKEYLDSHMDEFKIRDMYNLEPPYPIDKYYKDEYLENLKKYIKKAIRLINLRFK